jgi:hypothetical protein
MGGVEDREIIVLVLGLIVAGFAVANLAKLRRLPRWPLPMAAAALLLLGWTCSILETWFAPVALNVAEHAAYVAHSVLMLLWAYTASTRPRAPLGRVR